MSNNPLYDEYKKRKEEQNNNTPYKTTEQENKYYKAYIEAKKARELSQKNNIQEQKTNVQNSVQKTSSKNNISYKVAEQENKYYKAYIEAKKAKELSQKNNIQEQKTTQSYHISPKSQEVKKEIPRIPTSTINPSTQKFVNQPKINNQEENTNKLVDFIEGITLKKYLKFITVTGILAYIFGYILGQGICKTNNITYNEEQTIETTNTHEDNLEEYVEETNNNKTNDYKYVYDYTKNFLKENYDINVSEIENTDTLTKTLKRNI